MNRVVRCVSSGYHQPASPIQISGSVQLPANLRLRQIIQILPTAKPTRVAIPCPSPRPILASSRSKSTAAPPLKSLSEIPGPKGWPVLGSIFDLIDEKEGYPMFVQKLHQKYGDTVKYTLLGVTTVSVTRPNDIKEVYTTNQSAPLRECLAPWAMYRQKRQLPNGVTMELSQKSHDEGKWRKYRRPIGKLLDPKLVASYVPRLAIVADDLANTLKALDKHMDVADVRKYTELYGFEGVLSMLASKSLKVLGKGNDDAMQKLMSSVNTMFLLSNELIFGQLPLWKLYPTETLKKHDQVWDLLFEYAKPVFAERNVNKDPRFAGDGATDFFDIMLDSEPAGPGVEHFEYSELDQTVMGVELILAGIDTTSNASQWLVWCMAQNPHVQERLAKTLHELMGPEPTMVTADIVSKAKLNGYVEEVLRLHSVIPQGSRLFAKDMELFGYKIPAYTRVSPVNAVSSKDPRNFRDPLEFDETRLERRECPFGNKGFGAGSRQCPGERFARMELAVLLGTLVHRFKIVSSNPSAELKGESKLLSSPKDIGLTVRFVPRV